MTAQFVSASRPLGSAFDLLAAYAPGGVFLERAVAGVAGVAGGAGGAQWGFGASGGGDFSQMLRATFDAIDRGGNSDGPPPFAFATIPFNRRNARMLVPRHGVRRDARGGTWAIDVDRSEGVDAGPTEQPPRPVRVGSAHGAFSGMQLRPIPAPDAYVGAVAAAVDRIRAGELRKVVLARTLELAAGRQLDPVQLLHRLRAVEPEAYTFAVGTGSGRVLVGATPELLVSRFGGDVRSNPLAGSAPRFGDPARDRESAEALLASAKEREEHELVVVAVQDTLAPMCESLEHDEEPELLGTANVWHLSTEFRGLLRDPAPDALTIAAALHPTPAVCGVPRDAAAALIRELEPFHRNGYAGPVGWVDANGDGEFVLALRCAELKGDVARLFAGAGIVSGSLPHGELDETERKFRAFLDSLRWG
jgi:isochorismate synthase